MRSSEQSPFQLSSPAAAAKMSEKQIFWIEVLASLSCPVLLSFPGEPSFFPSDAKVSTSDFNTSLVRFSEYSEYAEQGNLVVQ